MLSWFHGTPEIDELYIAVRDNTIAATLESYVDKRKQYVDRILRLFHKLGYQVEYTNPDFAIRVIQANGWGTGGDLRCALDQIVDIGSLGDDFLVCYADYIINRAMPDGTISLQLDLSDIIEYHYRCKKALGTVMTVAFVVVEREAATRFGVGRFEELSGVKIVREFMEKPDIKEITEEPAINAGICVFNSQFILPNLDKFLPGKPDTGLERNLIERLAREEKPMVAAYLLNLDAWFDVGTLEQLVQANILIASKKEQ
jgi:NDP-sugar pyrophosphorylase family protein